MEKINSIEQLDALGAKICELLQVGIDKANTVVPETLQQIVAWQMWSCFGELITIGSLLMICFFILICICKTGDKEDFTCTLIVSIFPVMALIGMLIFHTIPHLTKVFVAPNLVIIEQLGGLVK